MTNQSFELNEGSSKRKIYRGRAVSSQDLVLWVVPGLLIPLGFLTYGIFILYTHAAAGRMEMFESRRWFFYTAFSLIPFTVLTLKRFFTSRVAIGFYEKGLLFRYLKTRHPSLLWHQITGLRIHGKRYHFFGEKLGDQFAVVLESVHGEKIKIPSHIADLPEFVKNVKQEIYPRLLPSLRKELSQGQQVSFGNIKISNRNFIIRGQEYPWTRINTLAVESGNLLIAMQSPARKIKIKTGEVVNVDLMLKIIDRDICRNSKASSTEFTIQ